MPAGGLSSHNSLISHLPHRKSEHFYRDFDPAIRGFRKLLPPGLSGRETYRKSDFSGIVREAGSADNVHCISQHQR